MTAIVDYKAGNLTSVKNAFAALGEPTEVTCDALSLSRADRVVFPGVGAARSAMDNLRALGLADAVSRAAAEKPFLGICLGMQILFDRSEENGGVDGLGVVAGRVRRFPAAEGFKIPQIGWNSVGDGRDFYFVHSYYAELVPETCLVAEYAGVKFTAMVRRGRLWACQFHPEKSGRTGLELLKEWLSC
ncbi:MAG: imidazole glycerol phosphate synthase subunit HisH [Kiritimatiellae bacterium]|nr:imidazole glycerol phosphate synthase subunit HisH [Kiritimatiellia bacterium]